ncbi:MAG: outer membrane beta-barrel protein [Chitinophagaceae bacterium]
MKFKALLIIILLSLNAFAQKDLSGVLTGNVLDDKKNALEDATVQLLSLKDSAEQKATITGKDGAFAFNRILFGYYKLKITYTGFQSLTIDSLHFRAERFDFNINDITLKSKTTLENLEEVIVYSEKPLIESKDGNITFNAGESALNAGSSASELLTNVPLVTKDPTGKILVRGKEPKILIDDKPTELNQQQLQDLLESLPGSAIEKIEVLTNPPPQYANEQGGVINIVTRKGRVGVSGRVSVHAGTRGDAGMNGNINYRKQGFSININAGAGYNRFEGEGYSIRENLYRDSTNFFKTENNFLSKNLRPNFRANIDYDINKKHALNLTLNYNQNNFDNENFTEYRNINRLNSIYRLSERTIQSDGENYNPNLSLSYTLRTKKPGEVLKFITNANFSKSENNRHFYQEFLNPDDTPTGLDSTQQQINSNNTNGYNFRLNYDVPFKNKKTSFSTGSFYNVSHSDIVVEATYKRRADGKFIPLEALSNDFTFHQYVTNLRASAKQILAPNFSISAGISVERTRIWFELYKFNSDTTNNYWSLLPFANINRNWKEVINLTASYRRTIRRPGINELNPTIDESDPYNVRNGNPGLLPSLAHNFDLVLGRTKKAFYLNLGLGYNIVEDIFSSIRTRISDTKTEITWQNISNRAEYEVSTWSGYTLTKNTKINFSASYTYNKYSSFDKNVRKFRDGGSFASNLNANYTWKEIYSTTSSFTFNRFANPQGSVKSNVSMNIGLQAKMPDKKLTLTLNIIDPFTQQQNRTFTYASNFALESFNTTQTRNLRLSVSYNLSRSAVKKVAPSEKKKQKVVPPPPDQ